ncbi:MAG: YggU family protein [Sedimentisphaerales bacterium]|nr:YggU family protein [Sedimentisphaerales bacterium]
MGRSSEKKSEERVLLQVKVVPGSSKTAIVGFLNDTLKIKVAAAPERGKANQALVAFLAEQLGIRKKDITIVCGQTSPVKQIAIRGRPDKEVLGRLTTETGIKGREAT